MNTFLHFVAMSFQQDASCQNSLFTLIVDVHHTFLLLYETLTARFNVSLSLTQLSDDDERMSVGSRGSVRVSITPTETPFIPLTIQIAFPF